MRRRTTEVEKLMAPKKKSSPAKASPPGDAQPLHEEIALRAYGFFLQRGSVDGWDLDDWLQAEREVLSLPKKKTTKRKKSEPAEVALL
jgi:hypothetical protein